MPENQADIRELSGKGAQTLSAREEAESMLDRDLVLAKTAAIQRCLKSTQWTQ